MNLPVVIEGNERVLVGEAARVFRVPAGAASTPARLEGLATESFGARLPATLASVLRAEKRLDLSNPPALEADDVWFTCALPTLEGGGRRVLVFDGLATVVDVFLNGEPILRSENAFHRHEVDVTERIRGGDELAIRCASLDAHLAKKRPRPRWKTRLVASQNLRFVRTSLLGRTTGFCPAVPAVGPFRPIVLERRALSLSASSCVATAIGEGGRVDVRLSLAVHDGAPIRAAFLEVEGQAPVALDVSGSANGVSIVGAALFERVERWWPHTHGTPTLHAARVRLESDGEARHLVLPPLGFRTLEVEAGPAFGLRVNGTPVFARGAVWTTEDVVAQHASPEVLREALLRVRDAGMNMVRIGGTMAYESDAFHAVADELGILVFQDLAFANMDYPIDDPDFRASVDRELRELLGRIGTRPSTAVVCGNSEVEQQAAMLGLARELWRSPLFGEVAPALVAELAPGVAYVPSSPSGGTMPFHVNEGVGHYYGVGAYLRPLSDARAANVGFAGECLAFANVPCQATIDAFLRDLEAPVHHPRWKERVPRDRGASWDFEDVREHYLEVLFGVSARTLRYEDPQRHLALSRVVPGEVMARTFAEWRRAGSGCRGALVFFLQDFWPGAGFGIVDSFGRPKGAMRIAARSLAPLALLPIDEGVNGLYAHVANDLPIERRGTLRARLFRDGELEVGKGETPVLVPPRSVVPVHVDALFHGFVDTTYAYRFGPPGHDLVFLELVDEGGEVLARAHHLPLGVGRPVERELGLEARFEEGGTRVVLRARRLALFAALDLEGAIPAEDFVHLAPGEERAIALRPVPGARGLRGYVHPSNQREPTRIVGRGSSEGS